MVFLGAKQTQIIYHNEQTLHNTQRPRNPWKTFEKKTQPKHIVPKICFPSNMFAPSISSYGWNGLFGTDKLLRAVQNSNKTRRGETYNYSSFVVPLCMGYRVRRRANALSRDALRSCLLEMRADRP